MFTEKVRLGVGIALVGLASELSVSAGWFRKPPTPSLADYPTVEVDDAQQVRRAERYETFLRLRWQREYLQAAEVLEEILAEPWPFELDRMYLMIRLAGLYARADSADRAAALLDDLQQRVDAKHPLYPELLFVLARTALAQEDPQRGLDTFLLLIHAHEYSEAAQRALLELARYHREQSEYDVAGEYYDRHLGTYLGRKKRSPILVESVEMFLQAGWVERAETTGRQLWEEIRRYPEAGAHGLSLADAFLDHGHAETARWFLEHAAQGEDVYAQRAQIKLAEMLSRADASDEALAAYERAVHDFPLCSHSVAAYRKVISLQVEKGVVPALPEFEAYPEEGEFEAQFILVRARAAERLNRYEESARWLRPLVFRGEGLQRDRAGQLTRTLLAWAKQEGEDGADVRALVREALAVRPANAHSDRALEAAIEDDPDLDVVGVIRPLFTDAGRYELDMIEIGLEDLLDRKGEAQVLGLFASLSPTNAPASQLTYFWSLARLRTDPTEEDLAAAAQLLEGGDLDSGHRQRLGVELVGHHLAHAQWREAAKVAEAVSLTKTSRRAIMTTLTESLPQLATERDSGAVSVVIGMVGAYATSATGRDTFVLDLAGEWVRTHRWREAHGLLAGEARMIEKIPQTRQREWMPILQERTPVLAAEADAAKLQILAQLAQVCAPTPSARDAFVLSLVEDLLGRDRAEEAVAVLTSLSGEGRCNPPALSALAAHLLPRRTMPSWTPLLWGCDLGQRRTLDLAKLAGRHGHHELEESLLAQFLAAYPESASNETVIRRMIEAQLAHQDGEGAWETTREHLESLPLEEAVSFAEKMRRFYERRGSDKVEWLNSFILANAVDGDDIYAANQSLGEYYLKLQNHAAALPHLAEAFRLAGDRPIRDHVKIGTRMLEAVEATGQDADYADRLVQSLRGMIAQVEDPDQQASAGNQLAKSLQELGRVEDARDVFWETAEMNPQTQSGQAALFNLAKSHAGVGETEAAIDVYKSFLERYGDQEDQPWPHIAMANLLSLALNTTDIALQYEVRQKTEAMLNGVKDPQLSLDLAQYFGRQGHEDIQGMLLDRALNEAVDSIENAPDVKTGHENLRHLVVRLYKQGFADEAVALGEQYREIALGDDPTQQTEALYRSQYDTMRAMLAQRSHNTSDLADLAMGYLEKTRELGYKAPEADFLYLLTKTTPPRDRWGYREQLAAKHGSNSHALPSKIMLAGRAYHEEDYDRALALAQDAVVQAETPYWKDYGDKYRYNAMYVAAALYEKAGRVAEAEELYLELSPFVEAGRRMFVKEVMDGDLNR